MDSNRFDTITRLFARRKSRRAAVGGGLGLAATAIAGRTFAQDATPSSAGEDTTHPNATARNVTELFTQAFESGTWEQAGEDDTYTLTLTGAAAQTVYFSDRPERLFGLTPMNDFITLLDSDPTDPPNAALVTRDPDSGAEDILLVVLENPQYDASTATLTYDATMLTDYQQGGLSSAAIRQQDYDFPASFGQGGLFIDGFCSNQTTLTCYSDKDNREIGQVTVGQCWSDWDPIGCVDCHSDVQNCHDAFPDWCAAPTHSAGIYTCHASGNPRS